MNATNYSTEGFLSNNNLGNVLTVLGLHNLGLLVVPQIQRWGHLVYCPTLASGSVLSSKSPPPTHPPYTLVEDKQGHEHLAETDKASQTVLVVRDHLRSYGPLCSSFSYLLFCPLKISPFFSLPSTGRKGRRRTPVRLPKSSKQH